VNSAGSVDQGVLLKISTARLTRAVIGASVCSVSLIEPPAICFVSSIIFSIAAFVKLVCRSIASSATSRC